MSECACRNRVHHTGFVLGFVMMLLGFLLKAGGRFTEVLLPKIGYMVFSASGPGSYSAGRYAVDLSSYYAMASWCTGLGAVLAVVFYLKCRARPKA